LMLFRLRRKDGSADPFSAGTYVDPQGRTRHLTARDFLLKPGRTWQQYPVEWTIAVPQLHLDLTLQSLLDQQELTPAQTGAYWEGAIAVKGSRRGVGYLEMTGYRAPVKF
jgi:predicted secreted hydrolase